MKNQVRAALAAALVPMLTACATSKTVDERIAASQAETNQRIESVASQVEDLQQKQRATDTRLDQLSQSAQEALRRAEEAGVLAKGQVAFEQSFSDDAVKFNLESHELSREAKAALDTLAGRVKSLDSAYFMEVQGHTDDTGTEAYNEDLGQRRAEAVRRYLSREHQLPLNRISTISYGDTLPVESNRTRSGRAANRRVVVVVLE